MFRQRFGRVHHDLPTHWPFQLQIFWRREVVTGCGWMSYLSWDYPKQMRIIWMTLRIQHVCGLFQVNWIMLDMFLFVQWSSYNHAIRPWSCFCLQRPFEADTWVQFFVQRWGVCVYIYMPSKSLPLKQDAWYKIIIILWFIDGNRDQLSNWYPPVAVPYIKFVSCLDTKTT